MVLKYILYTFIQNSLNDLIDFDLMSSGFSRAVLVVSTVLVLIEDTI